MLSRVEEIARSRGIDLQRFSALEAWHVFKVFIADPLHPNDTYGEIFQAEGGCIPAVGEGPLLHLRRLVDVRGAAGDHESTVSIDCYVSFDLPLSAERFPLFTVQVPGDIRRAVRTFVSATEAEAVSRDLIDTPVDQEGRSGGWTSEADHSGTIHRRAAPAARMSPAGRTAG